MATEPGPSTPKGAEAAPPGPRISVLIGASDPRREPLLRLGILSVCRQTLPRETYDVHLVTSYSTPGLVAFCAEHDVDLLVLAQSSQGIKQAAGLLRCAGEVIVFMDDDDLFVSDKLRRVAARFRDNPDLIYYHNGRVVIDDEGRPRLTGSRFRQRMESRRTLMNVEIHAPARGADFDGLMALDGAYNTSCISLRRRILDNAIPALLTVPVGTDVFFLFVALGSRGTFRADLEPLTYFRLHGRNSSGALAESTSGQIARTVSFPHLVRPGFQAGERYLREMGALELADEAHGFVQTFALYGALESTSVDRAAVARGLLDALQARGTHAWSTARVVVVVGLAYLVAPRTSQRLYSWMAFMLRSLFHRGPSFPGDGLRPDIP